ncbi:MAG: DNA primase [Pirellulales bacterium]
MTVSPWQDAKEQVRQSTDIVDLVGSYLSLRRQGRNYVAHCPWHDDSRPSLNVNQDRQSYKCWVCDIGGDVFSFAMRMEGVDFREALEMLAERAGITLTSQHHQANRDQMFDRRNLLRVLAWAEEQFHHCLLHDSSAQSARNYLQDRGITQASVERFQLGFSPDSWDWLLNRASTAGHTPKVLERVGLAISRQEQNGFYDRFRGRLLFPIRDVRSRPIAFGGRQLPNSQPDDSQQSHGGAKYINSPETPLFSKSTQLYALDLARDGIARESELLVMEGYTDVIMAHQHGIDNAVAVLGTALGERHIPLVRRFTDRITLVLDGDEAGKRRTMQILDDLLALFVEQEIDLRFLALPKGGDPCDVIGSQGSEAFRQRLSNSVDAIEYKIRAVTNGLALATDTHRSAQAVEEILSTLSRVRMRSGSTDSPALLREQQVLAKLAREFGIAEEHLRLRLAGKRRDQGKSQRSRAPMSAPKSGQHPYLKQPPGPHGQPEPHWAGMTDDTLRPSLTVWEQELIELLLSEPKQMDELAKQIGVEDMQTDTARNLYGLVQKIYQTGALPSFDRLMLEIDTPEIKNLLVNCDEQAQAKAQSNIELRRKDLLSKLERRQQKYLRQHNLAQLKRSQLQPQEEEHLLAKLFASRQQEQAPEGEDSTPETQNGETNSTEQD